jgi:phage terminase large subunit
VLGGDTAGEGSDFYTTKVLCNLDGRTAATLHRQRMDEDKYAEQVFCLGQYYHDALVALEINYSRAPTRHLQQLGYPNLYRREVMTGVADQTTLVPGFETNRATRPIILDELVGVMRDDTGSEVDLATLGEMMTFIRHKNGKKAADIGMHDDLVMARAIATHITAHQTRAWMPVPVKKNTFIEDNFRTRESERGEFMDWGD